MRIMSDKKSTGQSKAAKVLKAYRLKPEIVQALQDGWQSHEGYSNETQFVEDVLSLALGLPVEKKKLPRVKRVAPTS